MLPILPSIAQATGGEFFWGEARSELEAVYRRIDELQPLEFDTFTYRPTFELYYWPLGAIVVVVVGYHLVMAAWSVVVGRRRRTARA